MASSGDRYEDLQRLASLRLGRVTDESAQERMREMQRIRAQCASRGLQMSSGVVLGEQLQVLARQMKQRAFAVARTWHQLIQTHRGDFTDEAHDYCVAQVAEWTKIRTPIEIEGGTLPHGMEAQALFAVEQARVEANRWLAEKREEAQLKRAREEKGVRAIEPRQSDVVTGLLGKAEFSHDLLADVAAAAESGSPLACILFDLDKFKPVNDELGHVKGDEVLARVASCLSRCAQGKGRGYRWGGDEFSVLLPNHTQSEGLAVAERLREAIEKEFAGDLEVTATFGVAAAPEVALDPHVLEKAADDALIAGKASARNRVYAHSPVSEHASSVPNLRFIQDQIEHWIAKLRETQARNGKELQERVDKISVLLARTFGLDSEQRRSFAKAPDINEVVTCPSRVDPVDFPGTHLQFRAELYILALERVRKRLRSEQVHPDFVPWDPTKASLNP